MEKTKENNKLIAKFMGAEIKANGTVAEFKVEGGRYFVEDNGHFSKVLRYPTSWDWLMPVVAKIDKMQYQEWYDLAECEINGNNAFYSADIKIIYGTIIDFIKWYNKQ